MYKLCKKTLDASSDANNRNRRLKWQQVPSNSLQLNVKLSGKTHSISQFNLHINVVVGHTDTADDNDDDDNDYNAVADDDDDV